MRVKQTITFKPSPEVQDAIASGNIGQARYGAKLFLNNVPQPDEIVIPAGESSFTIEVEVGTEVAMMMAAYDRNGILSVASTFAFKAIDKQRPERPMDLSLGKVVPVLNVLPNESPTAVATAKPAHAGHTIHKMDENEPQIFNIEVKGHADIKDCAIGLVLGLDPMTKTSVHCIFEPAALKPGVKVTGVGREYEIPLDHPGVRIMTPDQETITLAQYAALQVAALNEATDAANAAA